MLPVDRGPAPFTASWSTDRFLFVFKGLRLGKATFFAHETGRGDSSFTDRAVSVRPLDQLSVGRGVHAVHCSLCRSRHAGAIGHFRKRNPTIVARAELNSEQGACRTMQALCPGEYWERGIRGANGPFPTRSRCRPEGGATRLAIDARSRTMRRLSRERQQPCTSIGAT